MTLTHKPRRRQRAMAVRQALRLCEAELATHARNDAGVPAGRPGGEPPRITAATTRAALRAAGLPPRLAATLRGRLRLIPGQEGEQ
ncbi:MAG: hypothetical protein J2P26_00725 [Nocardiopsaceae bacterium]|nr:hypothetical protein [Nocardiopsaceae bacterium]